MDTKPLVSVVMPFHNTPLPFMQEAVKSVSNQSYDNWELLLVNDGSAAESTEFARQYATIHPQQVRYLEHNNQQSLGASASRQLAIDQAHGRYIAFLDADDLWLPNKLAEQVSILVSQPDTAMLYGNTLYWFSWTDQPENKKRDHFPTLGLQPDTLYPPPTLLPLYLDGKAAVPCTCSVVVKRDVLEAIGGFEPSFRAVYTDQVLYAKVCLAGSVYVVDTCWDWYRQHSESSTGQAARKGQMREMRQRYLNWLAGYLAEINCQYQPLWQAVRRQMWLLETPAWLPWRDQLRPYVPWSKKWLLRAGLGPRGE
jgi:glycosyltransferase involved in cell wall biosynthesis